MRAPVEERAARGCARSGCRGRRRPRRGRGASSTRRARGLDLGEGLVPGDLLHVAVAGRRLGAPAARRSRSGSSCSWCSVEPFGQMKPRQNTSSRSPRMRTTVPSASTVSSRPQVASHSGQVRWWTVSVPASAPSIPSGSHDDGARCPRRRPGGQQGGVGQLASVHAELMACRSPRAADEAVAPTYPTPMGGRRRARRRRHGPHPPGPSLRRRAGRRVPQPPVARASTSGTSARCPGCRPGSSTGSPTSTTSTSWPRGDTRRRDDGHGGVRPLHRRQRGRGRLHRRRRPPRPGPRHGAARVPGRPGRRGGARRACTAQVLPSNRRMLACSTGRVRRHELVRRRVVEVRTRASSRRRRSDACDLRPGSGHEIRLGRAPHRPTSVAVIGASRDRGRLGHQVFRNLLRHHFTDPVYPVNPLRGHVASVRATRRARDPRQRRPRGHRGAGRTTC